MTTEKLIDLAKKCGGDIEYWMVNPPKLKAICFSAEALEKFASAIAQEPEAKAKYSDALAKEYFDKLNGWMAACIAAEKPRDELLALVEEIMGSKYNLGAAWSLRAADALARAKGGAS